MSLTEIQKDRLYSTVQVAKALDVSRATIREWMVSGKIVPAIGGPNTRIHAKFLGDTVLTMAGYVQQAETKAQRKNRIRKAMARIGIPANV